MFEKEIQFLNDFNLNKIKKLGSQFTFEKLLNTDLHPAVLQYISGELDHHIFEDRYRLLENSNFDYSGSKISEYFGLMSQEIKRTKKFSTEEIKKYIEKAVNFNINFISQPRSALTNIIFRDKRNSKSISEINVFFNFIYYYSYLKDIFNLYTEKRKVVSFSSKELELILSKIDNELFTNRTEELIDDVLYSISDFYNDGGVNKTQIPVILIEDFLKEKNLQDQVARLNKAFSDNKKTAEIDELKFILFSKVYVVDTVEEIKSEIQEMEEIKEKEEKKINTEDEFEIIEAESHNKKTEEKEKTILQERKPDILNEEPKIVVHKKPEEEIEFEEIEIEPVVPIEKQPSMDSTNDLTLQSKPAADISQQKETKKPAKDIFNFLDDKETTRIVGAIFNDDEDDFANILEKLSDCINYDAATEVLKSVFFKYRINPYSKEAITLTNAVSNYFDQG